MRHSDSDGDTLPDYMDIDSDGDGIGDKFEGGTSEWKTILWIPTWTACPTTWMRIPMGTASRCRRKGVADPTEEPKDTDGDGSYDSADTDADGDALRLGRVNIHGTDAYDADTDGDGFSDGGEVAADTSPTDEGSTIDGIYVEVPERTGIEENFEFELRIQMGDIAFLLDTTCSMSGTANAMAMEFSSIVDSLSSLIPDAEYGFSTYDD